MYSLITGTVIVSHNITELHVLCILYTTLSRLHTHEAIHIHTSDGKKWCVCVCNIINCNCIVQVVCSIVGIPLSLSFSVCVCGHDLIGVCVFVLVIWHHSSLHMVTHIERVTLVYQYWSGGIFYDIAHTCTRSEYLVVFFWLVDQSFDVFLYSHHQLLLSRY